jgi:hypothetical protein
MICCFHRRASPLRSFSPFCKRELPFVSSSANTKTATFRLHDEQTVSGLRKITSTSVFRFQFDAHASMSPLVHVSSLRVSMSPCLHVYVSMSPFLHAHVSMSPCLHASMYPSLYVSMSVSPCLCLHVYVSMSMSPCLCLHVSMFMSPCFHVSMSLKYSSTSISFRIQCIAPGIPRY